MRYVVLVALTFCCLLQSNVSGQHIYTAYGPTQISCGSYTAASPERRATLDWWVLGFVSGTNYERGFHQNRPDLESTDSHGLEAWVAKYCAEHPLDGVVTATVALVKELSMRAEVK